ncbi:hypothetical protein [Oleiagrimonas soli]|uniref:Uncharacterized protein n=1 Tax=Oleiagrimonas soli TaxID=1543381 RepID=A0A099CSK3_9GAMM|nr:hypothetical protein [Oleiagrimonas soli]KGI76656.1 hypothetical protein LF63_0113855 [Oleiagrimonas soli]MBB6185134.1 hypothetical protein [Oleiagrimonas soli]
MNVSIKMACLCAFAFGVGMASVTSAGASVLPPGYMQCVQACLQACSYGPSGCSAEQSEYCTTEACN